MLGDPGGEAEKLMIAALDAANPEVVTDACIGLGLVGHPASALEVVKRLRKTTSDTVQAYMVVALSHLGGRTRVRPLLGVLADGSLDPSIRASAATALGILVDPRAEDPLFEIDAVTNPYGLTIATRELVRVY